MHGKSHETESLEALFLRWRDDEDSEALAEVLARSEDELLVIARRQVRDESAAWDLVQETWHTVLRDARRWDAEQRLMPWLVGILQIEVRRARRAATRIPDPARVTTPTVPEADAHLPEAEVREHVTGALARLPSMYREVLSMHLFEDLTHAEIAQRTGRETGTVRVQVFRGLAQLRKLVPASLSLGTALAILAPRSEAARLAPLLDGAARIGSGAAGSGAAGSGAAGSGAAGSGAAGSGAGAAGAAKTSAAKTSATSAVKPSAALTSTTAGGISSGVGTAWLLGAAVATLVTATVWFVTRDEAATLTTDRAVAVVGPAGSGARAATSSGTDSGLADAPAHGRSGSTSTPIVAPGPQPGVRLVARVVGLETLPSGAPTLRLRADARGPRVVKLDAAASFEVDLTDWYAPTGLAPREFIAEYDHPNGLPVRVPVLFDADALTRARTAAEAGARQEIPITFRVEPPAARVHGRAGWNDDAGADSAFGRLAALFAVDEVGGLAADPVEGVAVRDDGTFSLRAARTGRHVVVVAAFGGATRPETMRLDLVAGEDRDLGRIALGAGSSVTGVVHADPNAANAGLEAVVRWNLTEVERVLSVYGTPLAWTGRSFERAGGEVAPEHDGRFAIRGLGTGAIEFERGYTSATKQPMVEFPIGPEFVVRVTPPLAGLVLEPPNSIARVTVRANGRLVEGAIVRFEPADGSGRSMGTDARGFVDLIGARAGTLSVFGPGFLTFTSRYAGPLEGPIDVDLQEAVPPGFLQIRAPDVAWKDVVARVFPASVVDDTTRAALRRGELPSSLREVRIVPLDEVGQLTDPLDAGSWWIHLSAHRDAVDGPIAHARPFVAEVEIDTGATTQVDVAFDLAGRIRFAPVAASADAPSGGEGIALELIDATGRKVPLPLTSLLLRGDARQGRLKTTDRLVYGANATSGLLEPGNYVVRATIGTETRTHSITIEAGRTTVVDLEAP